MRRLFLISSLLVAAVVAAYWPIRLAQFTEFDDPEYVTSNPDVFYGLTWHGIVWSFTSIHAANWHPLTWMSHMLDCDLFSDNAAGHHLMNVGFHAANAVLLFLLFARMTGFAGRSAFVAALFALHPLHVESVAWIAERKDVLSTFFFMLALGAYVRYAELQRAQSAVHGPWSVVRGQCTWYFAALLFFALGLMSKAMLVTLPFVMLLLDYWPLGRFGVQSPKSEVQSPKAEFSNTQQAARNTQPPAPHTSTTPPLRLLAEKLPFFVLAVVMSGVTFWAQNTSGAVAPMEKIPLEYRLANASSSFLGYLLKTFWPAKLAAFYPFPPSVPEIEAIGGALLMGSVTLLAFALARLAPYVAVGWLWFAGTLVPVIGLVQVGGQAMADRYTYIPLVGLSAAVVWALVEFTAGWRRRRLTLGLSGFSILCACFVCTRLQTGYWHDSITLFSRAIQVTGDNALAQLNLGFALSRAGRQREAVEHLDEAIRLRPGYPGAYLGRGNAYGSEGKIAEAIPDYLQAIRNKPDYEQAYYNLGKALALEGKLDEAKTNFLAALHWKPDYAEAQVRLGNVLVLQGRTNEALIHLRAAIEIQPNYHEGHYYLGAELARQGKVREAAAHFRAAIKLRPGYVSALNDLAWMLATCPDSRVRNVPEAIRFARRVCELTHSSDPKYLDTLAVAQSEAGQMKEAIGLTEQALRVARTMGDTAIGEVLEKHLGYYRSGRSYTQATSPTNATGNR